MRKLTLLILFIALTQGQGYAQNLSEFLGDESALYAETKQLNQFFRRFNNEEDTQGQRYYPGDPNYRTKEDRLRYIQMLFDKENKGITNELKTEFSNYVIERDPGVFLDFHGGNWFAEVETTFLYKGEEKKVVLFLKIQKEPIGSKWVLTNVFFEPFSKLFVADSTTMKFLHPMSHELEFMNLNKALRVNEELELYAQRSFKPDYLMLLFYEMKLGNLSFKNVDNVKFHFFQVDNWYFEITRFNRPGLNRGWLMSNLARINDDEKRLLMKYIFYEDN